MESERSQTGGPDAVSRRALLGAAAGAPLAATATPLRAAPPATGAGLAPQALQGAAGTKIVLLGTCGGPTLGQRRHMTSQLLVSEGRTYVVDCGMTVANRIAEAGVAFPSIDGVFITHHHPDHNAEYGPLLLMAWMGGRTGELDTFGPPPLAQITEDYLKSIRWTTDLWIQDVGAPPFPTIRPHEAAGPGVVLQRERLRVTAALVRHPPIVPAFAYRFDFPDRSVVFSGDTAPVDTLLQLARGADVLVHEAMYVPAIKQVITQLAGKPGKALGGLDPARLWDHMLRDHTSVEDVGRIAQQAGVKTLVLSHLTPGSDFPPISDEQWRSAAARQFGGEIIVGRDLMVI